MRAYYSHSCNKNNVVAIGTNCDISEATPTVQCPFCKERFSMTELHDDRIKFSRIQDPETWGDEEEKKA